jgi:hypothetical protein
VRRPFAGLAADYPGPEAYPPADFRIEWGPVFHRGRLDGSALVLVLGQDPGQHECIARRILVGEAGQRVQGFLRKLGIERSYVMINAFLYSVFGQRGGERHADSQPIIDYRHRWLDALLDEDGHVQAVVAFGHLAHDAFERWAEANRARAEELTVERLTHPTMPEASSRGNPAAARTVERRARPPRCRAVRAGRAARARPLRRGPRPGGPGRDPRVRPSRGLAAVDAFIAAVGHPAG